jgi:hypothetical protein
MTRNYGLAGGTLDATHLIEAALPRLCTTIEQAEYLAGRSRVELEAVALTHGKPGAEHN